MHQQPSSNMYGTVIILNGPSASGKSSIQKAFQKQMMPQLWLKIGIDTLYDMPMPDVTPENLSHWQSPNSMRWVETTHDESGNKVVTLYYGSEGAKVLYAMNSAIAAYAHNGCNVIVDYIAYKPEWLVDLRQKLYNIPTYYVAVTIPLDVLEKREKARATSPVGHARSHYNTVYGDISYDLIVNSETNSPEKIAQQIQSMLLEN